jgi:subtilase family serine protease
MHSKLKTGRLRAALLGGMALAAGPALAAAPITDHAIIGRAEATRPVHFDVVLPLRDPAGLERLVAAQHDPNSPLFHQWITPQQFGLRFGPDSATVERVAASLRAKGFQVQTHTRSLHVYGSASQVESAFGARMMLRQTNEGHVHIATTDALHLPPELTEAGAKVYSFMPHNDHVTSHYTGPVNPQNRYSATGTYWFDDLKQTYGYPAYGATATVKGKTVRLDGTGVTIGALMSSDIVPADIQAVFDHENWSTLAGTPDPTITTVDIDGGGGIGGDAFDEASLDTQEEITGAPGAHVILYSIPSLADGDIFDGYVNIVEQNAVDMVSSSFAGCELDYLPSFNGGQNYTGVLTAEHELFLQGNAQGITFLAGSGDGAGRECATLSYLVGGKGFFLPSVAEPAADPNVTAVGGTNVVTTYVQGSLDSLYAGENAWDDYFPAGDPFGTGGKVIDQTWGAGGGYSQIYKKPTYQALVQTGSATARAIPDVGMQVGGCPLGAADYNKKQNACNGGNNPVNGNGNTQRSAVVVSVGGQFGGFVGTSVSSPEFTGAMAPLVALHGRMGNLNPYLYDKAAAQAKNSKIPAYHTGIPGYNAVVQTNLNPTYSLSTGVGTPLVANLLGLPFVPLAGTPQTASNP